MIVIKGQGFRKILVFVGVVLLVIATLLLILWQGGIYASIKNSKALVETIYSIIPTPTSAVLEEKSNPDMPTLSVNGTDFIGVLEMPSFDTALPVGSSFESLIKYPCKFSGSIYDKSLKIGATTQKGQFDFFREISVGDSLFFTDMKGNRYTYTVTNLRYEKHADQTALNREEALLTLFIKNIYDFEYLIVSLN